MRDHRRDEQNQNQSRQQPGRTDNERSRQRQINSADRNEREQRLPAWLRFVHMLAGCRHGIDIALAKSRRNTESLALPKSETLRLISRASALFFRIRNRRKLGSHLVRALDCSERIPEGARSF